MFTMTQSALCQTFGAEGTSWEYCIMEEYETPVPYFTKFSFANIGSIDEVNQIEVISSRSSFPIDTLYLYTENGKIYLEDDISPLVLFDYNLELGDTFEIRMPRVFNDMYSTYWSEYYESAIVNPYSVVISGVEIINIDGELLKQWTFDRIVDDTELPFILIFNSFTERLGFNGFLIPVFSVDFLELNPLSDLVSFQDGEVNYKSSDDNCLISSTNESFLKEFASIYPNPTSTDLIVEFQDFFTGQLMFKTVTGQIAFSQYVNFEDKIILSFDDHGPGFYIIEVVSDDGLRFTERILVTR
jgi:hypothetical protein